MARYLDTGTGDRDQYVGRWLDENIVTGLQGFRGQFGYFRFRALEPFAEILHGAAQAGHPVRFVLGSNYGSLVAQDVQKTLRVLDGDAATLTVVSFGGAEFHPKTMHVVRADGSVSALVGSANFTPHGLGQNVEAALILDSRMGDDAHAICSVAAATDRWHTLLHRGVFQIHTDADIQALVDEGVINAPQPQREPAPDQPAARDRSILGRLAPGWTPRRGGHAAPVPALIPPPPLLPPAPTRRAAAQHFSAIACSWCKKLASSDAQQVKAGTNPTGKLRLAQAGFPINHRTWFRNVLFADLQWTTRVDRQQNYEVANVRFEVRVRGKSWAPLMLSVDHAPHRVAGQGNVPTVLSWGPDLGRELRKTNHIGDWVVITRDSAGHFALTIQQTKPHWAP